MERAEENNIINNKSRSADPAMPKVENPNAAAPAASKSSLELCCDKENCLSLDDILRSFNAPLSEEQAWSLIFQSVLFYRNFIKVEFIDKNTRKNADAQKSSHRIKVPKSPKNLNVHKDGTVHISDKNLECCLISSQKKILLRIGIVVYTALDFNLPQEESCIISSDLEQLINLMTYEEVDDEGIERDSDEIDDERFVDTKELDHILELCAPRVLPSRPEEHYRAVCRALTTESIELRVFLSKVFTNDAEALRIKADAQSSRQELAKLDFRDWARFWMQVVDELRRGVRLKKINFHHTPTEYALTPYEILMEDIRSRRYQLRKVMVNGNIPPRVKKDARAVILEFIRSRPPLRKATERKLAPLKRNPSPREQLLDSIRKGKVLKPIAPGLKNRLLPPTSTAKAAKLEDICKTEMEGESSSLAAVNATINRSLSTAASSSSSTQPSRRLISVDFSLFKDDEVPQPPSTSSTTDQNNHYRSSYHQSPRVGREHENNQNNINTILRRTTYDLATQCESRRASLRRHTIVGCQSFKSLHDSHSVPPSRPQSRQSTEHALMSLTSSPAPPPQHPAIASASPATMTNNNPSSTTTNLNNGTTKPSLMTPQQQQQQLNSNLNSINSTWGKNSLDEQEWREKLSSDRLSLTLEEIVHIRSVITKAELESLPMGIQIKEDVEKRKLCFLCLRTKFGILGPRGVPCKLCQRTVCAKCYTKMRIPTEHFSNVPVQLLSPSRQNSPSISNVPSPSHHGGAVAMDESFPRSLMERLLRTDVDRKTRNTVGSAPSSPRNQRSASSTPGSSQQNSLTIINNGVSVVTGQVLPPQPPTALCAKENQISLRNSLMSRSMDGPKSLPPQSPRSLPQSNCSTLDRRSTLKKAFGIMQPQQQQQHQQQLFEQKEGLRGELMAVCNDCRGLVLNIIRYSRKTRSSARNMHLKNLTLDLSPVYKR